MIDDIRQSVGLHQQLTLTGTDGHENPATTVLTRSLRSPLTSYLAKRCEHPSKQLYLKPARSRSYFRVRLAAFSNSERDRSSLGREKYWFPINPRSTEQQVCTYHPTASSRTRVHVHTTIMVRRRRFSTATSAVDNVLNASTGTRRAMTSMQRFLGRRRIVSLTRVLYTTLLMSSLGGPCVRQSNAIGFGFESQGDLIPSCASTDVLGREYCPHLIDMLPTLMENKRTLLRLALDAITGGI